jgi:hypothetical protein
MKTLLLSLFFIFQVSAEEGFQFERVDLRGSGCKPGNSSVIKSPDQQTVSILFDDFFAEIPNFLGDNDNDQVDREDNPRGSSKKNRILDHKVCNIVLKTRLKEEEAVKAIVVDVDFRGNTLLEKGTAAVFRGKFVSVSGPKRSRHKVKKKFLNRVWKGDDIDDDWTIRESIRIPIKGACARKNDKRFKLVLRTILQARNKKRQNPDLSALITLDTSDITSSGLKFKILTKKCRRNGNGRNRRR